MLRLYPQNILLSESNKNNINNLVFNQTKSESFVLLTLKLYINTVFFKMLILFLTYGL